MDKNFSTFLKGKQETLKKIICILSERFEYVSILASDCQGQEITVSEKQVSVKDSSYNERGFVVRVYKDGLYSEYSFDEILTAEDVCNKIIKSVNIAEPLEKSIYVKANPIPLYEEKEIEKDFSRMDEYEDIEVDEVIKKCKNIIANSMEENEYIISGRCSINFLKVSKTFISNKKNMSQVYAWADASYQCIVNRDDVTRFNFGGESGVSLKEVIKKLEKRIYRINKNATALLDSTKVEPGEYECITAPEVTGLLAHEAFGHGVEMDMFVKNRALGKQYINKQVGSELVEMHDGAIPYKDVSSYFFDDEGVMAQDTTEIKDGILITGIADAIAACQLGIKPTGNGKRQDFTRKAYTRMTATYFSSKKATLDEMIQSIKYGYLIDSCMGGMEDPKNWGIQCMALVGKEIKDGKLTGKIVSPLIMTGYVPDVLKSISMVSKDFQLYGTGACGKGYKEWVKTSIGGPYLKVKVKLG